MVEYLLHGAASQGENPESIRRLLPHLSPQANLASVLAVKPRDAWDEVLDLFPCLLDARLLATVQAMGSRGIEHGIKLVTTVARAVIRRALQGRADWTLYRGEQFLERIALHPKALEWYEHVEVARRPNGDFDFGFHDPKGDPPVEAIRSAVAGNVSARAWFIDSLRAELVEAGENNRHLSVLYAFTDYHTGRLAGLNGSRWLEAPERNPDKGMRGSARLIHPAYRQVLRWELEAAREAAEETGRLSLLFPLVRMPQELFEGLRLRRESDLRVDGIGFIPEAPINFLQAEDAVAAAAPVLRDQHTNLLVVLDLEAIRRGWELPPDSSSSAALLEKVIGMLLDNIESGGRNHEISVRCGMSWSDLDRLVASNPGFALTVAQRLQFTIDS